MKFSIAVLPGDGIGPEVIYEAVKVLEVIGTKFGHKFDLEYGSIGGSAIDKTGSALPDKTANLCSKSDAILYGAVGGPKWDGPDVSVRPEDGILAVRKTLDLFANIRPVKGYKAISDSSPIKPELLENVDMIILRELTGGLYFSKPKKRWETSRGRRGVDTLRYSEEEIERIVRVGFELASRRKKLLTSVDKANVLESSRLWREIAIEISSDYPNVELEHIYVDNLSVQIIRNPSHYDVIVAENTFGDIISDEAAVLTGSLGMLPSASLSEYPPDFDSNNSSANLYEPIHGSAPDIAGQGIANPIGTILSMAMMLRLSFGLEYEASNVEMSVEQILSEGYRTSDISTDNSNVVNTQKMGDLIAMRI
jgi:3-isopropylmalate dehydrogenase